MKKILTILPLFITLCMIVLVGAMNFSVAHAQGEDVGSTVVEEGSSTPTVVVDSMPDSSIAKALLGRVETTWPWYVARVSGLVAGLLLIVLMLSGSGFITGYSFRFLEPITAWATHRAMGIALGVSVLIHMVALYFDTFIHFDIASLLIPFASDYGSVEFLGFSGSLYVAFGVFALYVFVAVIFTSLFWIDKKPKTWKVIHILSYVAMVLVFVHGLYLGTDLAQGVFRFVWIVAGVLVTLVALLRLWRAKTV